MPQFIRYDSKTGTYRIMIEIPVDVLNNEQKQIAKKIPDTWVLSTEKKHKFQIYQEQR